MGLATAIPAATRAVTSTVARADLGRASGTFTTMRQLGGAFGVAVVAAAFATTGATTSARAFADGYPAAMAVAAALALAGLAAALLLPGRRVDGT
ncbi:hypothetical protein [Streptomyces sp. NBC_01465]|uniref:hypothetical protein n=1 Tax=Streptomyces sp. NBC_01465 TaxID=2903878 RepID=UPI002E339294|nr:hypothetical protein [Streptomyces sp. NBC_01465]